MWFIIYGTDYFTWSRAAGEFYCPACKARRLSRRYTKMRFLTLYFLPVIPLGDTSQWLECRSCLRSFGNDTAESSEILERADRYVESQRRAVEQQVDTAEFERTLRRAMILMALVDGPLNARQIQVIARVHQEIAGWIPVATELTKEAAQIAAEGGTLAGALQVAALRLLPTNKTQLFSALYRVATASGTLSPAARSQVGMLPGLLSLPVEECREIIRGLVV